MPLNPLAPAFFLHNQLPSDPPITLRRPTTMNLPLAQIFCGTPSPFVPPPTLHIHVHQPFNDGTDLPFTLQKNPSKEDPESVQPLAGPSTLSLVSSPSSTMSTRDRKVNQTASALIKGSKPRSEDTANYCSSISE